MNKKLLFLLIASVSLASATKEKKIHPCTLVVRNMNVSELEAYRTQLIQAVEKAPIKEVDEQDKKQPKTFALAYMATKLYTCLQKQLEEIERRLIEQQSKNAEVIQQ